MSSSGSDVALSLVYSAYYAHTNFYYSGIDYVDPHCMVFPFPLYEKAYSHLAVGWYSTCYSRWPLCKVVKHSAGLLISEIPITSHNKLVSLSSSLSSCICSSLSRKLTLYVAPFSMLTLFRWLFLTQRLLLPLHVVVVDWPVRIGMGRRYRVNEIAQVSTRWLYQY